MKQPAPTDRRREPLPEERPKPGSEDPQAPARMRAILANQQAEARLRVHLKAPV